HRQDPAQTFQTRRAKGLGIVQGRIHGHTHGFATSEPAAGDQTAPMAFFGLLVVDMKRLRIILLGEIQHLFASHRNKWVLDKHTHFKFSKFHVVVQRKKPPRCAFGLLPPEGEFLPWGGPATKKPPRCAFGLLPPKGEFLPWGGPATKKPPRCAFGSLPPKG